MKFYKWLKRQKTKAVHHWRAFGKVQKLQRNSQNLQLQFLEPRVLLSSVDSSADLFLPMQLATVAPKQASVSLEGSGGSSSSTPIPDQLNHINMDQVGTELLDGVKFWYADYDYSVNYQQEFQISLAGDVNGDGYEDYVVGVHLADYGSATDRGKVFLVYGQEGGLSGTIELRDIENGLMPGVAFHGISYRQSVGYRVSSAGDVNGDGYDDLIISNYKSLDSGYGYYNPKFVSNRVYLVYGRQSGLNGVYALDSLYADYSGPDGIFVGSNNQYQVARSVSSAGDVNHDGFDDIIFTGTVDDENGNETPVTYLLYGRSQGYKGRIEISGLDDQTLDGAIFVGCNIDSSLAALGDVNGDGYDDFMIGSPGVEAGDTYPNETSRATLVYGSATKLSGRYTLSDVQSGAFNGAYFTGSVFSVDNGTRVTAAGDVNGDGLADFLIGESGYQNSSASSGRVTLIYGHETAINGTFSLSTLDQTDLDFVTFHGEASYSRTGSSVSSAGDVNGDGFDDFLIGAEGINLDDGYGPEGQAYLIYGQSYKLTGTYELSAIADHSLHGVVFQTGGGYNAGELAGVGGDLNDDGFDDFLLGSSSTSGGLIYGRPQSSVSGLAWYDANQNGVRDDSEQVMADIQVNLLSDHGDIIATTTTDANGEYIFDWLFNNYYFLQFIPTEEYQFTIQHIGEDFLVDSDVNHYLNRTYGFFLEAGVNAIHVDAGFVPKSDVADGVLVGDWDLSQIQDGSLDGAFFHTSKNGDLGGRYLANVGDVNGDGYDDFLISDYGVDLDIPNVGHRYDRGEVYLIYGRVTGMQDRYILDQVGQEELPGAVFQGFEDNWSGDFYIESAGDVNGDGLADFLISSWSSGPNGYHSGRTYLIYGDTDALSGRLYLSDLLDQTSSFDGAVFNGIAQQDYSGRSVSGAGDINGDGYDDLIIGANGVDSDGTDTGEIYIVYGQSEGLTGTIELVDISNGNVWGMVIRGDQHFNFVGDQVAIVGDINNDGFDDFVFTCIETSTQTAMAVLLYGDQFALTGVVNLSDIDSEVIKYAAFLNPSDTGLFLLQVQDAGDVNGDGFADFLIGEGRDIEYSGYGDYIHLIYGHGSDLEGVYNLADLVEDQPWGALFYNNTEHSYQSISSAGDVNGDGYDDIIIGASWTGKTQNEVGYSYLIYGGKQPFNGPVPLSAIELGALYGARFVGTEYSGLSVSSAGDVNHDGAADFLIGAPYVAYGTYLIYGQTGLINTAAISGKVWFDENKDGLEDDQEDPMGNVTVVLRDAQGKYLKETVTDAQGGYLFDALPEYEYIVEVLPIDGFELTDQFTGNDPLLYSHADTVTGKTQVITLSSDLHVSEIDFGLVEKNGSGVVELSGLQLSELYGAIFNLENTSSEFELTISSAGDVDGDGFDDILVSDFDDAPGVYLIYGQQVALAGYYDLPDIDAIDLSVALFTMPYKWQSSTYHVAPLGDVNGDGYADFMIGSYEGDDGSYSTSSNVGDAILIYGQADRFAGSVAVNEMNGEAGHRTTFKGVLHYDYTGYAISSAGDVNADGFDDILIGAYDADGNTEVGGASGYDRGLVFLIYGQSDYMPESYNLKDARNPDTSVLLTTTFNGQDDYESSGYSVAPAGDVNGDGFDDILIGTYYEPRYSGTIPKGDAYLVYGSDSLMNQIGLGLTQTTNAYYYEGVVHFYGEEGGDRAGAIISSAGDVNGDGFADLLIGVPSADHNDLGDSGSAYLIYGQTQQFVSDFYLSVYSNDTNWIDMGYPKYAVFEGLDQDDHLGVALASAGDVNADGFDDFLLGVPNENPHFNNDSGQTYLIYGSLQGLYGKVDMRDFIYGVKIADVFNGIEVGDLSGAAVAHAGDVNGDGYDDVLLTAPGNSQVYLIYGGDTVGDDALHATIVTPYLTNQKLTGNITSITDQDWYQFVSYGSGLLTITGVSDGISIQLTDGTAVLDSVDGQYQLDEEVYYIKISGDVGNYYSLDMLLEPQYTQVVGRYIFYNNSYYDTFGNDSSAIHAIDYALQPLRDGQVISAGNVSNYSEGINGVVIDIISAEQSNSITADDFELWIGDGSEDGWQVLDQLPEIAILDGVDGMGADRVVLTWDDGTIVNTWLMIRMLANANTGLQNDDEFYFCNAIGDVDNDGFVDISDVFNIWNNRHTKNKTPLPVGNHYDLNRDGFVDISDIFLAWNNRRTTSSRKAIGASGSILHRPPHQLHVLHDESDQSRLANALIHSTYKLNLVQIDNDNNRLDEVDLVKYLETV